MELLTFSAAGSNGRSYIQSTKASGTTSGDLSLNPQGGNIGIHMNTPLSPLHIKQTNDAYPVVGGGLRLERNANTNHWEMATDNGDDLDFSYNNVATAYINHVNGSLFSPSDLRLKKDINPIGTVLPAMLQLQPQPPFHIYKVKFIFKPYIINNNNKSSYCQFLLF